jgi:SAM-dependent methyltransferase
MLVIEVSPAEIRRSVAEYYEAFLQTMTENERACPWLFRHGAEQFVEELYGSSAACDLSGSDVVSLGCGNPLAMAMLTPGECVLDLGCGLGLDCILAARQVGATGFVIGVELARGMIERAAATGRLLGLANLGFLRATMEMVPLVSASVDVVISNCAANLVPDKRALFDEVRRLLRPGGRFVFCDIVAENEPSTDLRRDLRRWAGCVSGAQTPAAYCDLLQRAGLVDVRLVEAGGAEGIVERPLGAPKLMVAMLAGRRPETDRPVVQPQNPSIQQSGGTGH